MIKVIVFILMFVFLMLLMKPELYPFVALIFFFLIGCFLFILWIREKLKWRWNFSFIYLADIKTLFVTLYCNLSSSWRWTTEGGLCIYERCYWYYLQKSNSRKIWNGTKVIAIAPTSFGISIIRKRYIQRCGQLLFYPYHWQCEKPDFWIKQYSSHTFFIV